MTTFVMSGSSVFCVIHFPTNGVTLFHRSTGGIVLASMDVNKKSAMQMSYDEGNLFKIFMRCTQSVLFVYNSSGSLLIAL